MAEWRAQDGKWEVLTPGDWQTYGLPERIAPTKPAGKIYPPTTSAALALTRLEEVIGGEERVYSFTADRFRYDILVNAASIVAHIGDDIASRSPYLWLIPETIATPQEVWMTFERHRETGMVVLRQRIIKMVQIDKQRAMCVVINARDGRLEAWTFFPRSKMGTVRNLRQGKLVWRAE
jgi:hypothetical protein